MDPSRPEQVFLLVMLHTGTMFAVILYFWPRWRQLWSAPACHAHVDVGMPPAGAPEPRWHFLKMVVLATA